MPSDPLGHLKEYAAFQEGSAEHIENSPSHEDHTDEFPEAYWHGYAAAMRDIQREITSVKEAESDA